MKILIIDDEKDSSIIESLKIIAAKNDSLVVTFTPTTLEYSEIYSELEVLCDNTKFDIALLYYKLWGDSITGDDIIPVLKRKNLPFIGFSSDREFNAILAKYGSRFSILKYSWEGEKEAKEYFNRILNELSIT